MDLRRALRGRKPRTDDRTCRHWVRPVAPRRAEPCPFRADSGIAVPGTPESWVENMKLSSFNVAGMLLVLTLGIAVGALMFRDLPQTSAATDRQITPTDAPPPVIPISDNTQHPLDAKYLGVIFARQSADI